MLFRVEALLDDGTFEAACGQQDICFMDAYDTTLPAADAKPQVSMEVVDAAGLSTSGNNLGAPGAPVGTWYKLTNNSPKKLTATFDIESDNVNELAVLVEGQGTSHNLSAGEGDDFPMEISSGADYDACFPLGEPAYSVSPSATQPDIYLAPGEDTLVAVYARTWGNCADGSCSTFTAHLSGDLDGDPFTVCASANLMVDVDAEGELEECDDGGEPADGEECGENEDCQEQVEMRSEWWVTGIVLHGPTPDSSIVVFLQSANGETLELDEQLISPRLGRLQQTVSFPDAVAGETVTLEAQFTVEPLGVDSPVTVNHVVMGTKAYPDENLPHTVVGLGEVELSTSPYTQIDLMDQESVWVLDAITGEPIPVTLTDSSFEATGNDYTVSVSFEVHPAIRVGAEGPVLGVAVRPPGAVDQLGVLLMV